MIDWIIITLCDQLIMPIMIFCGYLMKNHAPQEIGSSCGYRSKRSVKNMDTWIFANHYCGRLWIRLGLILLIPSVLIHIPFLHSSEGVLAALCVIVESVQIGVMLGSIYFVEKALKKHFDDNGRPRKGPEVIDWPEM